MTAGTSKRPARPPRTRPAEVRRGDLLSAAGRLFLAQGLEETTVEQITAAAGVAKGSFYLQFASKEALVEALRRRFLEDYLERLRAVVGELPAGQHATRLGVWTAVTVAAFLDGARLHALLFHGPRDYLEEGSGGNPAVQELRDLLQAGAQVGAWSLPDPQATATFLFHGLHALIDEARRSAAPSDVEDRAMALVERLVLASD